MNHYDAIIVGAGPAGTTCAASLRKSGLNVKLFDKKVFPRVKPCAGWITPQVIDELKIDVDHYRLENILQPITGFRTGVIGGRQIETNYSHPVSYGIRRIEFDNYLLEQSGVPCEYSAVKQISFENKRWNINGDSFAPVIVGAGGHFCPVARFVRTHGNRNGSCKNSKSRSKDTDPVVVFAQEVEFEMSARQSSNDYVHPEIPELFFCADMKGYGWCFRKGNFLNVGLGRIEKTGLSAHVREFCNFLRLKNKLVDELPPQFLGHAYRLYAATNPLLFDDGLLLIGDSAGLAYPQSGEGIRPAVESAMIAADVISNANGEYDLESLATYGERIHEWLGPAKPYQTSNWLPAAWLQNIACRLMATHWFARNVVIDNWFLHSRQSALRV